MADLVCAGSKWACCEQLAPTGASLNLLMPVQWLSVFSQVVHGAYATLILKQTALNAGPQIGIGGAIASVYCTQIAMASVASEGTRQQSIRSDSKLKISLPRRGYDLVPRAPGWRPWGEWRRNIRRAQGLTLSDRMLLDPRKLPHTKSVRHCHSN